MGDAGVASDGQRRATILAVVGARPNFMKIAPLLRAAPTHAPRLDFRLVHTGQHYDVDMNDVFFRQLGIPAPDASLDVGSGTHAVQTGAIMQRFEPVLDAHRPDWLLVVGDVNSTLACALVAAKKGVPVAHVEAGLRSRDRSMPEEINRVLTDQLSERLYVTERAARTNLLAEGIAAHRIVFAGNVMVDTLDHALPHAVPAAATLQRCGVDARAGYGVVTLHRPSNVDDADTLARIVAALRTASRRLPFVFPVHPRTRDKLARVGAELGDRVHLTAPLGYFEMLGLMRDARCVLTDSGGMQEETTALGVPCLTLRPNTERPVTLSEGTNRLLAGGPHEIDAALADVLAKPRTTTLRPELWDGRAAERIVADLQAAALGTETIGGTA